jgi:WD40 repeat protein
VWEADVEGVANVRETLKPGFHNRRRAPRARRPQPVEMPCASYEKLGSDRGRCRTGVERVSSPAGTCNDGPEEPMPSLEPPLALLLEDEAVIALSLHPTGGERLAVAGPAGFCVVRPIDGERLAAAGPQGLRVVRPCSAEPDVKKGSCAVEAVAWSHDGTLLAASIWRGVGRVELSVFNAEDPHELVWSQEYERPIVSLAWAPAGSSFLAAAGGDKDGFVRIIDAQKHKEPPRCIELREVYGVAWGRSDMLACASAEKTLRVMRIALPMSEPEIVCEKVDAHEAAIRCVDWCHASVGAERLATGSSDRTVAVWEVCGGELRELWRQVCGASVESLSCSPAGPLIGLGLRDGSAVIMNAADIDSSPPQCWQLHDLGPSSVKSVAWQGETVLYAGSEHGVVRLNVPKREAVRRVLHDESQGTASKQLHSSAVNSVSWSTDGALLSSGSLDECTQIITGDATLRERHQHGLPLYSSAWNPENNAVACGLKGQLRVVDTAANTVVSSSVGLKKGLKKSNRNPHVNSIYALAWTPDGKALVTGDHDGQLCIWYRRPHEVPAEESGHDLEQKRDKLNDSEYFNRSEFFRLATDDYKPHGGAIRGIAFAPDGEHFATASWDTNIRVFHLGRKEQALLLDTAHELPVTSLAWASKSNRTLLATGSNDATICILDVDINQQKCSELRRLKIHERGVLSVSWTKDSTRLATGGVDAVVNIVDTSSDDKDEWRVIWKIDSGQLFIGAEFEIRSVSWRESNTPTEQLAVGSSDGAVCIVSTYEPFVKLVGFLAACRQDKRDQMAGSVLQFCHRVKYAAALPGNSFAAPTTVAELVLPKGWTVFHELASGSEGARKEFWENSAYAFPEGCFVPTTLDPSTTEGSLKKAGLEFDFVVPFTDLTALDIAILRQDIHGTKYLLSKLRPDMELTFTANVTRSLVLLSKYLPYHIASALEILEKSHADEQEQDTTGLFRAIKDIAKLTRPLEQPEVRGLAYEDAMFAPEDALPWKSYQSVVDAENDVESACKLQLLRLGGIAGHTLPSFKDLSRKQGKGLNCSPYEALVNNCPLHLQDELFESRTVKALTQFKWDKFVKRYHCGRLAFYCAHCLVAAAALLLTTQNTNGSGSATGSANDLSGSGSISTNVLMGSVAVTNTIVLADEFLDILQDGVWGYVRSAWNLLDVGGLVALYVSVAAFATGNLSVLTYSGALGVFFNSFSILQLLRPFEGTGPVIKVTTAIVQNGDIAGFFYVSVLLMVGFSVGFAVSMPKSKDFGLLDHDEIGGPFHGLLVVFQSTLGGFDLNQYTNPVAVLLFPVFSFVMVRERAFLSAPPCKIDLVFIYDVSYRERNTSPGASYAESAYRHDVGHV